MPYLSGVVVLDLNQAAVLAALLGNDERGRRARLDGLAERTRAIALDAIEALESGAVARAEELLRRKNGHSDVREAARLPSSAYGNDTCSISEAAELTGLCGRQIRRLAPRFGRKVGGRWQLSRTEVLAFADERYPRRSA